MTVSGQKSGRLRQPDAPLTASGGYDVFPAEIRPL
jgi:hypothetical protein